MTARLNIKRVFDCAPACCKDGIRLALELKDGGVPFSALMRKDSAAALAAMQRKGVPSSHLKSDVRDALRWLNKSSRSTPKAADGLFETLAEYNERRKQHYPAVKPEQCLDVGSFFVPKAHLLRIIIDARAVNSLVEPIPFAYFPLDTLITTVSNLSNCEAWYAVNLDLRHWFHQLPMPDHLRPCLAVNPSDRDLADADPNDILLCRGHPMGYGCSPFVGESSTFGMVLRAGGKLKPGDLLALSHHLDIDERLLEELNRPGAKLPTWIPFRHGGGIFVMLDNVLIVTPRRATADAWVIRMKGVQTEFNALIKNADTTLRRITLKRGDSATCFEFMGVRWFHSSRRVLDLEAEERALMDTHIPGKPWPCTHRLLARVLGLILWFLRVGGQPLCYPTVEGLMKLYSIATPPPDVGWDSQLIIDDASVLFDFWKRRRANQDYPAVARIWNDALPSCFYAVDASEDYIASVKISGASGAIQTVSTKRRSAAPTADVGVADEDIIAVAEAHAIHMAIMNALAAHPDGCLITIATDSLTAKAWHEKWYARNLRACQLLCRAHTAMTDAHRLALVYVPTDDNVADEPSRGKECEDDKLRKTLTLLRETESRARKIYRDPVLLLLEERARTETESSK